MGESYDCFRQETLADKQHWLLTKILKKKIEIFRDALIKYRKKSLNNGK